MYLEIFIAVVGVVIAGMIGFQTHLQTQQMDYQTYLSDAERRGELALYMGPILDKVDQELKEDYLGDSIRNLSPQLIGRIAALSHNLKPYRFIEEKKLIETPLSPERGQLLFVNNHNSFCSLVILWR